MTITLSELREKLSQRLEESVVADAEAVESDSRPSRSLTIERPSCDAPGQGAESTGAKLRHCRSCVHLKVSAMPTVPDAGKGFLTVDVIGRTGRVSKVLIDRVCGKLFSVCELENWECGPGVTSPKHMESNQGYFRTQADMCADYKEGA